MLQQPVPNRVTNTTWLLKSEVEHLAALPAALPRRAERDEDADSAHSIKFASSAEGGAVLRLVLDGKLDAWIGHARDDVDFQDIMVSRSRVIELMDPEVLCVADAALVLSMNRLVVGRLRFMIGAGGRTELSRDEVLTIRNRFVTPRGIAEALSMSADRDGLAKIRFQLACAGVAAFDIGIQSAVYPREQAINAF